MPSRQDRRKVSEASISLFYLDQRIENHGTAVLKIEMIGIDTRILAARRIISIDPEFTQLPARRLRCFGIAMCPAVAFNSSSWLVIETAPFLSPPNNGG